MRCLPWGVALLLSAIMSARGTRLCCQPAALAAPSISVKEALHGALVFSLSSPDPTAELYYTLDGSNPSAASTRYFAPVLVTSKETLRAVARSASGLSAVAKRTIAAKVASGTLVWSDEFSSAGASPRIPDSAVWTYDTGNSGFGNKELETYCAPDSSSVPCDPTEPNAFVATDGFLHVVAREPSPGVYTSARLKTQGLISFQYGRIEARIKMPEAQGMWPAFWMLGSDVATVGWPACGEQDIMEHIDAPQPDWVAGSLHGPHGDLTVHYPGPRLPEFAGGAWHTYGVIWSPGVVKMYVDSPANVYASWTPESLAKQTGAIWPFDSGPEFLIVNLAVGGNWPGAPDALTKFPAEMLVDFVRVYAN